MIYDSSEGARQLLLTVGEILHPASLEPEVMRLADIMSELEGVFRVLLPRNLELAFTSCPQEGLIRVARNQFVRHFLSLISLDIGSGRISLASISVSCQIEGDRAKVQYDSTIGNNPQLDVQAIALFEDFVDDPTRMCCTQVENNFSFAVFFPLWRP